MTSPMARFYIKAKTPVAGGLAFKDMATGLGSGQDLLALIGQDAHRQPTFIGILDEQLRRALTAPKLIRVETGSWKRWKAWDFETGI